MQPSHPAVVTTRHEGWVEITLNRPERRNAINRELVLQLRDALRAVSSDDSVRAVLLSGAGDVFCSGIDLKALNAEDAASWRPEFNAALDEAHQLLMQSKQVLIVALQAYAINGAAAFALAGDLLVAGQSAFIHVGEAPFGMPAPRNIAWLVLRHGEATTARFALLGERVGSADLLRLGVATEVVADDQVLDRARAMAARIGGYPADAIHNAKTAMRQTSVRMGAADWFAPAAQALPKVVFVPKRVG